MESSAARKFDVNSGSSTENLELRFREGLKSFCEFLFEKAKLKIEPYTQDTLAQFRSLQSSAKFEAVEKFEAYSRIFIRASEAKVLLADDRALTWWAIKEFNLRPTSDFFDKLSKSDVLEIYNANGIQIYRNFRFFDISGYTLGDVFVYPWQQLYERTSDDMQLVADYCARALSGLQKATVGYEGPKHHLRESLSLKRYKMLIQFKYFSPLFDAEGNATAFICTSKVENLTKLAAQSERPAEASL